MTDLNPNESRTEADVRQTSKSRTYLFAGIILIALIIGAVVAMTSRPGPVVTEPTPTEQAAVDPAVPADSAPETGTETGSESAVVPPATETGATPDTQTSMTIIPQSEVKTPVPAAEQPAPAAEPAPGVDAAAAPAEAEPMIKSQPDTTAVASPQSQAEGMLPTSPYFRAFGNPDAPIVVESFLSLTCSHCADFHKMNMEELKKNYIDKGTVYYISRDFPLNAPAVMAAQLSRCLPADRYESFVDMLFKTQEQWAFFENGEQQLKQNAKLAGMTDEQIGNCLANADVRQGILDDMKLGRERYQIASTPTVVFNRKEPLQGAFPFESMKSKIDSLIQAQGQKTP